MTAAIGDGANDVSMIQEADVGLGKICHSDAVGKGLRLLLKY